MIFLLNCVIKASVILAAALLTVRLLRRQSAAIRHCVLTAGILSAAVSPGLSLLMPAWNFKLPVQTTPLELPRDMASPKELEPLVSEDLPEAQIFPVPPIASAKSVSNTVPAAKAPAITVSVESSKHPVRLGTAERTPLRALLQSRWLAQGAMFLWVAGILLTCTVLLVGTVRLTWIAFGAQTMTSGQWTIAAREIAAHYALALPPRLLQCASPSLLVTWGWRRPKLLLPAGSETWPEDRVRAVLCHELAHIRRGDWVVQITAELLRSVYWFNPIFWAACKTLRCESEQASDDAAINYGIGGSEYAEHLLDVVRSLRQPHRVWSYGLSMAHPSTLERRFKAILNPALKRTALTRPSVIATFAIFLSISVLVSMVQGSAAAPAPLLNTIRSIASVVATLPTGPAPIAFEQAAAPASSETDRGSVQGTVRRADLTATVSDVEITLEGGPADPGSVNALIQGVAGRGIVFKPKRIGTVDEVIRDVTDQAGAQGVGPGFPIFDEALAAFRATNAARFVADSADDGRFVIKDVPPGKYTLHLTREGFLDTSAIAGSPAAVVVEPARTVNVSASLVPGAVISGHIRDTSGQPVPNISVQVMATTYPNGYPQFQVVLTKQTDDRGTFSLFWLPPAEYYVAAVPPQPPPVGGTPQPAPPRTFYPGTLNATVGRSVSVRAGEKVSGIDFEIQNEHLATISGQLFSEIPPDETATQAALYSAALGRPTLLLVSRDPSKVDALGGAQRNVGSVTLNPTSGRFITPGILPGSYDLYARIPESNANGGAGFAFAKVPVDVKDENITGINITVRHSVSVKGTVTVDGKVPGNPAAIRIQLQTDGSGVRLGGYTSVGQRAVNPGPDGAFAVVQVPPGLFRIELGPGLPEDLYISEVRQGGANVFDSGIEIGSETPNPIQIDLNSGAGTVEGTVLDAAGKPLAAATIVLAPNVARRQNRALYHTATSDANGKFALHNIAPGGYQMIAWQQSIPAGAYFNASFLRAYEDRGRFVNVIAKSTVTEQIVAVPVQ